MTKLIPLSQATRALAGLTGQNPPPYRKLYELILDAKIPAEQINGRWHIDVATAAVALGMAAEPVAA